MFSEGAPRGCELALFRALAFGACFGCPAQAKLLSNGSFETGPAPGDALPLSTGSTAISGWVVTRTSIDYVGALRPAALAASRSMALMPAASLRRSRH